MSKYKLISWLIVIVIIIGILMVVDALLKNMGLPPGSSIIVVILIWVAAFQTNDKGR